MKFLLSVIDHQSSSASDSEMAAITEFNAELRLRGVLIFAGGLTHVHESVVASPRLSTDTPHLPADAPHLAVGASDPSAQTERVHFVSGIWIIDVPGPEEANALSVTASQACNRVVECRAFLD